MGDFSEDKRKVLHILMGFFALLLRWLPWYVALLCALIALLNNLTVLRWIGERTLFREKERKGVGGIIFYPISVFVLILLFRDYLHIASAGWAMMAFGDGFATLLGVHFGKKKLPWNNEKSWVGLFSSMIFGYLSMIFFIWWVGERYGGVNDYKLFIATAIVALISSFVETMKIKIDDNLTIPIFSGIFLYYLYLIDISLVEKNLSIIVARLPFAIIVSFIFALAGYLIRGVNLSGLFAGIFIGSGVWLFTDYKGFLSLLLFFILGTASTKIGYSKKKLLGIEEKGEGARSYGNVLGKGLAPFLFSILAIFSRDNELFLVAFLSSLCAGTFDTVSSELGKVFGVRTFSPLTFREVRKGEHGGISIEGLIFGIISSIIFSTLSFFLFSFPFFWKFIFTLIISSLISNLAESFISILIEDKGMITNEITNFLNTLIAGLAGYIIYFLS
ncbi:MAG: DUF92 domain-containing protein [Candidatus Aminicenantia bacterium]